MDGERRERRMDDAVECLRKLRMRKGRGDKGNTVKGGQGDQDGKRE